MKLNILAIFFLISAPSYLLSSEPSAFGAGDLSNPTPYGLTSGEKIILENNKKLQTVVVKSNNQANEVESIRDRIDGLQSIIENINLTLRDDKLKLKTMDDKLLFEHNSNIEFSQRLINVNQSNSKLIATNTENIEKLNLLIVEVSKIVDKINATFVSKDEFNVLIKDINEFKDLVAKEFRGEEKPKKSRLESLSNPDIYKKAKELYDKKLYSQSLEQYEYLISKNYKPATVHYMAGEVNYSSKNYTEALSYYKKSATLDDNAQYMPVLMLHTAISMWELGDKKNAKIFYNAIVSKYPNSDSAKIAQKKLSSLK
ncbi:tetratricopeptide repeat protein [Sulfurimonas sp.]|uniref:tetratricopeptide repeat protein n=1 Tax=Sulfurimonas sp. TaxID=2022749 RepID=UPI0025D1CDEF|nr:tetratricopeptide repeat protein [Sulfurimonas sp.]MDD5156541.1 tetratricopeptide repeat protein [Sulfurimonas sp.]